MKINLNASAVIIKIEKNEIKWGDIYLFDFGKEYYSEQSGIRPALIIQNNIGNKHSPTLLVCPITTKKKNKYLPTHVNLSSKESGLKEDSVLLFEQIRVVDKRRIIKKLGSIGMTNKNLINRIYESLTINFSMVYNNKVG